MKKLSLIALSSILFSAVGLGQTLIGEEFQINTSVLNHEPTTDVGSDSKGDFVVVWQSFVQGYYPTQPSFNIRGQRFTSDGSPLSKEFQVNSDTTYLHLSPTIGVGAEGNFIVVWEARDPEGSRSSTSNIKGQRYSSTGSSQGGEFQLNSNSSFYLEHPSIGIEPEGNFTVVWESDDEPRPYYSLGKSVQGRRFESNGQPIAKEFRVNTHSSGLQGRPSIGVSPRGEFVVVWESKGSLGSDLSGSCIQGQRFSSSGQPEGGQFQINSYSSGFQGLPFVEYTQNGDFVVAWASDGSYGNDSSGRSIQGQRFSSSGIPLNGEFQVNTYTTYPQSQPFIEAGPTGGFVVIWSSKGSSGNNIYFRSIQSRLFASDGMPIGEEFQVNTSGLLRRSNPSLVVFPSTDFVGIWGNTSGLPPSVGYSVQGQFFRCSSKGCLIFSDDFESGDTSAWSISAP